MLIVIEEFEAILQVLRLTETVCVCCVLCVCVSEFGGLLCSGGEDATKRIKLGVGGGDIRNFFSKTNLSNSITHSLWHSCNMLSGNRSSLAQYYDMGF